LGPYAKLNDLMVFGGLLVAGPIGSTAGSYRRSTMGYLGSLEETRKCFITLNDDIKLMSHKWLPPKAYCIRKDSG